MKVSTYLALLVFVTFTGLWGIPELVKTATNTKGRYPFVYFSSIKKKLLFKEFDGRQDALHDDEGGIYTEQEYDTSLPLLNFRQLTVNGEMPDSIDGIEIDPKTVRVKQMTFRYSPSEKNTPDMGLYIMYESLPKKAKLESPGDVFRLKNSIEFIDAETNTLNSEKSELFRAALEKAGYAFPAQWTYGNMNIRKPYDEGYFSLDAKGELYHIKMVNGRPFVRNTQIDAQIEPAFFSMQEPADKRFYGFLFDKKGKTYILEEDGGKYKTVQLDIAPLNLDADELMIMGNLMYWTVSIQTSEGKHYYALEAESLKKLRSADLAAPVNKWDTFAQWLFPVYPVFKDAHSAYISPRLHFSGYRAFIVNALLAALSLALFAGRTRGKRLFDCVYTLLFGIAGIVALAIVPAFKLLSKNKSK